MKKYFLFFAFILFAVITSGQSFEKGNYVGFHVLTITLNEGITMDQYLDVYKNKVMPAYEKNFQSKCYLIKSSRGECENCVGVIIAWKSEADWSKFWNKEGGTTDLGQAALDKLKPQTEEIKKLGTYTSKYTDWIVQ
jgi:hypothetical protein